MGSVLGGLLIGALLVMLFLRRRSQKPRDGHDQIAVADDSHPEVRQTGSAVKYDPVATQVPHGAPNTPAYGSWGPQELGATVPQQSHEMDAGDGARGGFGAR